MSDRFFPDAWPMESDWTSLLQDHFNQPSFQSLCKFVATERESRSIYPAAHDVFTAFRLTSFADTKVVILGQDPYHGPNQAHGLSFSVEGDVKLPPSLRNIYRELASDLGGSPPTSGDLTPWATQGVFLLNTVLTVRAGEANSHRRQGWEQFTDQVIRLLNRHPQRIVFLLWGKPAEKKTDLIDQTRHAILAAPHPSPLSAHRGFFGSRPFSKSNQHLRSFGRSEIEWGKL